MLCRHFESVDGQSGQLLPDLVMGSEKTKTFMHFFAQMTLLNMDPHPGV